MHARFRSIVALVCLVAAAPPAIAADAKTTPTLTLRMRSIDGLLSDAKYLATVVGKEDEASQFEGLIRSQMGDKGIFGIDVKRPIGFYVKLAADVQASASVLLLPIADQDTLLKQLEAFNIQATKEKDGSYSLNIPAIPVPVYFKFANKYLYLTALSKDALQEGNLLAPEQVLPASEKDLFSMVWNLDQVPDNLRQVAIQQLDSLVQREKDRKVSGESEAHRRVRVQGVESVARFIKMGIQEGKRLEGRFNVDQKGKQITADGSLSAVSGSKLAAGIADLGKSRSLFAGLAQPGDAMDLLIHFALPEEVRKALGPIIDEDLRKDLEKEKDAGKRALMQQFFAAITPSLKAGELDGAMRLIGPEDGSKYVALAGLKIKDGAAVLEAVRSFVKSRPAPEQALVQLDAEKMGDVGIHRVNAQGKYDAEAKALFGDNPIYFAVLPNAVVISGGPRGLEVIKTAISLQPQEAAQFSLSMSMRRLAPLMDLGTDRKKGTKPQTTAIADKVFAKAGKDEDKVVISLRGGTELQGHLIIKAPVLRFVAEAGEAKK